MMTPSESGEIIQPSIENQENNTIIETDSVDLHNWNKLSSSLICSLILIDSISKIKSFNPYPDDFIDNSYCLDKPKRQMSSVAKSYDHIWIDGVGWMHEDEIGHDS